MYRRDGLRKGQREAVQASGNESGVKTGVFWNRVISVWFSEQGAFKGAD